MKKNGVTDVVWLPDSETNWLYLLMQAEPSLRLIPVSREGSAFSLAAGLSQPPFAASQRGSVKWLKVTIGVRWLSWHAASIRR